MKIQNLLYNTHVTYTNTFTNTRVYIMNVNQIILISDLILIDHLHTIFDINGLGP